MANIDDSIFPAALALSALRSTSYKNTAYAVAELVDNSFDAEATEIGVALITDSAGAPPHTIAVLDNGRGMGEVKLKRSIQYGYSGKDSVLEKPLGKFGVGLVAASFSQCSDLVVMSWQAEEAATGSVPTTRIAIAEDMENILPQPSREPLPAWASRAFVGMPTPITEMRSGTLVVWHNVKPSWKRANTLSNHLSELCGRIYRNFISADRLLISIGVIDLSDQVATNPRVVPAIDPGFLTNWDDDRLSKWGFVRNQTLFDPYTGVPGDSGRNQTGDYEPEIFEVEQDGEVIGAYLITSSYRSPRVLREELRVTYDDPGDAPYGQLAAKLQGVSILRSDREIDLDQSWLRLAKSVDRWVSVSLDFDPDLDEVFGVSNDKQKAYRLADLASLTLPEIKTRIKEEERGDDPNLLACLKVAEKIKERLNGMQKIVKAQRAGTRSGNGSDSTDPTKAQVAELVATGSRLIGGPSLSQDDTSTKDHPEETAAAYEGSTSEGELAKDVRPSIVIKHDLKVDVVTAPHEMSSRIFHTTLSPGHMVVHLNGRHPLHDVLSRLLVSDDDRGVDEPEPSVDDALRAIRSLLVSYARAQAEASDHHRNEFERCSLAWGEVAERVFRDLDE